MATLGWILIFFFAFLILAFQRASLVVWTIGFGILLFVMSALSNIHPALLTLYWIIFLAMFFPLNAIPFRQHFISRIVLAIYRKVMPRLSDTEKEALTAGSVGWSAELFSGMPNWRKLAEMPQSTLSQEEQAFLDGTVEQLCSMIDSWNISRSMKIPESIYEFIKKEGFLGMIIPKEYGGKAFSAIAHSEVLIKLAGVSAAVATVVAVPNSLGPAELLLHYGTDEQKNHYLPRLASGQEIPCFALTSPVAGSDAGSLTDHGIICKHEFEGKEELCIRLNWNKRYITLAPIATLVGLAFKLYDPDHLLGDEESLGITCALIPANHQGVVTGRRHYPLDAAFPNGPTQGHDVIIPMSWIIGGVDMVGQGWRMLVECLSAGRAISLPSMVTGGMRLGAIASGSYARIRRQFHTSISRFGGVQEALARIGAYTLASDAVRRFTVSMIDDGQKPSVASAISKYHTTNYARQVVCDVMDVHGGKGICMGPNNYLAQGYIETPISITVEGANILTRSMMIFGQGAIRCHPYILPEMTAAADANKKHGLKCFDRALFAHAGFILSNAVRSLVLAFTAGRFAKAPKNSLKRYYQHFSRFSAALAFTSDMCMLTMGGKLKRLEQLSARLGDLLSYLYIGTAVLRVMDKPVKDHPEALRSTVAWICQDALYQLERQLNELLVNLPNRPIAVLIRCVVFPLGKWMKPPKDKLGMKVSDLLCEPSMLRTYLSENLYLTPNDNNVVGKMEKILKDAIAAEPLEKKLSKALKKAGFNAIDFESSVGAAMKAGILTDTEAAQLLQTFQSRMSIINVDDFDPATMGGVPKS